MLRVGGAVRGLLISADAAPDGLPVEVAKTSREISPGVWFIPMSSKWAAALDVADGRAPGQPMEGFELLSAGVIAYAEGLSTAHVVGYLERTYGLQLVDCAVAWHRGRITAGPSGSAVTASSQRSAVNDILDALGIDPSAQPALLTALADQ